MTVEQEGVKQQYQFARARKPVAVCAGDFAYLAILTHDGAVAIFIEVAYVDESGVRVVVIEDNVEGLPQHSEELTVSPECIALKHRSGDHVRSNNEMRPLVFGGYTIRSNPPADRSKLEATRASALAAGMLCLSTSGEICEIVKVRPSPRTGIQVCYQLPYGTGYDTGSEFVKKFRWILQRTETV